MRERLAGIAAVAGQTRDGVHGIGEMLQAQAAELAALRAQLAALEQQIAEERTQSADRDAVLRRMLRVIFNEERRLRELLWRGARGAVLRARVLRSRAARVGRDRDLRQLQAARRALAAVGARADLRRTSRSWSSATRRPEEAAGIVASFGDERLTFHNLNRRGPYPSDPEAFWHVAGIPPYNEAVRRARGRWIAPLGDDDAFRPHHIEALLDLARAGRHEATYGRFLAHFADHAPVDVGAFPPQYGEFGVQVLLYHAGLSFFEMELADELVLPAGRLVARGAHAALRRALRDARRRRDGLLPVAVVDAANAVGCGRVHPRSRCTRGSIHPLRSPRAEIGSAACPRPVRFQRPALPPAEAIERYLAMSRDARWFSNGGPCWKLLRARLAAAAGRDCVPVCSASLGLVVAIAALRERAPAAASEVLVPSFAFAASAQAAIWNGLRPVFVDVGEDHWHMDPDELDCALAQRRGRVAAVVALSSFGTPPPVAVRERWVAACANAGVAARGRLGRRLRRGRRRRLPHRRAGRRRGRLVSRDQAAGRRRGRRRLLPRARGGRADPAADELRLRRRLAASSPRAGSTPRCASPSPRSRWRRSTACRARSRRAARPPPRSRARLPPGFDTQLRCRARHVAVRRGASADRRGARRGHRIRARRGRRSGPTTSRCTSCPRSPAARGRRTCR